MGLETADGLRGFALPGVAIYATSGFCEYMCYSVRSTTSLTSYVRREDITVYSTPPPSSMGHETTSGSVGLADSSDGVNIWYLEEPYTHAKHLVAVVSDSDEATSRVITRMLFIAGPPDSLYKVMPRDSVAHVRNVASRAWDTSSPPQSGYTFSCKPDGERTWMVLDGMVWLYVRPTGTFPVVGWYVCDSSMEPVPECVVVDTERVIGHGFIFIDMLMDVNGVPSNALRRQVQTRQQRVEKRREIQAEVRGVAGPGAVESLGSRASPELALERMASEETQRTHPPRRRCQRKRPSWTI